MRRTSALLSLTAAFVLGAGVAAAQPGGHDQRGHPPPRSAAVERQPGPTRYQRVTPPQGWNARPKTINRGDYQHNYQASRSFAIGPYHPPAANWSARRWAYGQILPRPYWGRQYIIGDYWLFGLMVPPVGAEWIRYGNDALLISMANGEVLQAVYGAFG